MVSNFDAPSGSASEPPAHTVGGAWYLSLRVTLGTPGPWRRGCKATRARAFSGAWPHSFPSSPEAPQLVPHYPAGALGSDWQEARPAPDYQKPTNRRGDDRVGRPAASHARAEGDYQRFSGFDGRLAHDPSKHNLNEASIRDLLCDWLALIADGTVKVEEDMLGSFPPPDICPFFPSTSRRGWVFRWSWSTSVPTS